jgi:filamentous hemagglutinin family protein
MQMPHRVHQSLVATMAALSALIGGLISLPTDAVSGGGILLGGSAGIGATTLNQSSQNAIINWNLFNIGIGDTSRSVQPGSSAIGLNQVIGGLGSTQLLGTLLSNGQVSVANGNNVPVGPNAATNTAGVPATTQNTRNTGLTAGRYIFSIPGLPNAAIVNQGGGTAVAGGFAALVAPGMRNAGTITATLGTVGEPAGGTFTLDFYGDRLLTLAVNNQIASQVVDTATGTPLKSLAAKDGKLGANGGRVELTAAAARAVVNSVVNNTGVIEADSIGTRNGMIVLGEATAVGKDKGTKGGNVAATAERIARAEAMIDASGQAVGDSAGSAPIKGLAGFSDTGRTVQNVSLTGGLVSGPYLMSGLIGLDNDTVTNALTATNVSGALNASGPAGSPVGVGGPIGANFGTVTQSATDAVSRLGTALGDSSFVSGLIGANVAGDLTRPAAIGAADGLIRNVVPAVTYVVGGVGLVNGKANGKANGQAATGLLTATLAQTRNLLGTLGNTVFATTDLAVTQIVAPLTDTLTDTLGSQLKIQVQLNGTLVLASLTTGAAANSQSPGQSSTVPGGQGTDPALPPQFGSRFFAPPPIGETRFIKDEAILQIPAGASPEEIRVLMSRLGLSTIGSQRLGLLGVTSYRVRIGNGSSVASVIGALAAEPIVAGAQPNYIYQLAQERTQNLRRDPGHDAEHHNQNTDLAGWTQEGDAAQYALGKLGVIGIHRQLQGTNVPVAVIDSQIDVGHPDLEGVIAEQFDAVGQADPPHLHGTGMAGAIAAHRRLMGIAPAVRLYAIHAFSGSPANPESTTFSILKGLDWAAGKGVWVINMSFAGPRDPSTERMLKVAHDQGIVLIAAAGNGGPRSPPLYPGADPNVIAVTATDANDRLFSRANRGSYIAVAAPGVDILVPAPDSNLQLISGTSVASAEVSGVVALLLERNADLRPQDIRKILTSTATHLNGKDRDDGYGSGLVDPSKAIQTAGELTARARLAAAPGD